MGTGKDRFEKNIVPICLYMLVSRQPADRYLCTLDDLRQLVFRHVGIDLKEQDGQLDQRRGYELRRNEGIRFGPLRPRLGAWRLWIRPEHTNRLGCHQLQRQFCSGHTRPINESMTRMAMAMRLYRHRVSSWSQDLHADPIIIISSKIYKGLAIECYGRG